MKFEDLAPVWQEQNKHSLSPEVREAMIARVCRRVERLNSVVTGRDVRETIAAVAVIILFGWYWYDAPADYVISKSSAGFLVCWSVFIIYKLHRTRTIQQAAPLDAPVTAFCQNEVERLDRQIRLLGSVLWWYIAPGIIGANVFYIGLGGLGADAFVYFVATLLLAWGIYALNMRAVAKQLVPSRNELANLVNQLEDAGSNKLCLIEQPPARSSEVRRFVSVMVLLAALAAVGIATAVLVGQATVEYPKRAPFSGIRWEDGKPVVKIGAEWFTLVSLDGIAAEDIVEFSWWTYMDRWRKRFEEDLVEVLTRMGHEPKETVRLVVSPLGSSATQTLEDVPMTEANRWTIYNARRQASDQAPRGNGDGRTSTKYRKLAPYTGVRWEGSKPVVKVGEEWFTLVSLDGVAAEEIVAFSRRTYEDKWQKRFAEDLVEVLTRMGHPPQDTVTLVVQSLTSSETRTLEDVPMTEANRRAIYNSSPSP